ncbi:HAD family hydrolase [Niabella hirudinis]|uniref:HAD family hydrolase n=1 Tax=Niabella hirudinis TaxID=1285929 RepID=UPI003EB8B9DF
MSPAFWCLAGIHKFFKRDLIKPIAILLFRNRSEDEVQDWAEKFYNNYLSARKIESTNSILLNNHDYDLVLASATIDPVAKVIAGDLKPFCYFATKLERKNGIYTGRIQREISGRKPEVINEFFNGMVSIETAMSDNHSDYNLLHSACKKIAVCYTGKDENFWSKMKGVQIIKILKSE